MGGRNRRIFPLKTKKIKKKSIFSVWGIGILKKVIII